MIRKISTALLILVTLGTVGCFIYRGNEWTALSQVEGGLTEEGFEAIFFENLRMAVIMFALATVGYFLSFDTRLRRRPFAVVLPAAFAAGAIFAIPIRVWVSYEYTFEEVLRLDQQAFMLAGGLGLIPVLLVLGFEAINRMIWPQAANHFDKKKIPQLALICNELSLLFRPGQEALLKSVALARFRKGNRTDSVEVLKTLYDAGQADSEVLETLCKFSNEQRDQEQYLAYLRELHEREPDEPQILDALLDALVEQRRYAEALRLIEANELPSEVEALERYAFCLLAEGHLEKVTAVAEKVGELEGIPFRRSQTLLREVLSRMSEYVPALNILARHAERMALRDQRIRWLEKSLDANPRQSEIRQQLIGIYRELSQTVRLEELLKSEVRDNPRDKDLLFEFATVLYGNEKTEQALERLDQVKNLENPPAAAYLLSAKICFEQQDWDKARTEAERAQGMELTAEQEKEVTVLLARIERAVLTSEVARLLDEARENPDDIQLQLHALESLIKGRHAEKVVGLVGRLLDQHEHLNEEIIKRLEAYADQEDVPFAILNLLCDMLVKVKRYDDTLSYVRVMAERSMDPVQTVRDGSQKILRQAPHHLATLRYLGDVNLQHGRFTEMIHNYSLYLANGGEESEQIDRALAKAYISLKDYENARRFVNQLMQMEVVDMKLLKQILPLALEANQPEDAAEYLKRIELIDPRDPDLKTLKPKVTTALGERRFGFLKRELEAGKGGSELLEQLGDIARDLANYGDAITYYQRASRDRGNEVLARRCTAKLAYCYMKKRLDDLCTETLRDISISLDDDSKELSIIMDILYEIGELMLESKLYDKAERVFKQLCRIDAGYRDVLVRIESLRR